MLLAAVPAIADAIWSPPSADLSAQWFRADLFSAHGFLIFNDYWYAGQYLPGYSLLFPPLGALVGPPAVGVIAAVGAAGCFAALAFRRFGEGAALGVAWFSLGISTELFTGRITFALGVAVGLAALLAAQRERVGVAGVLALLAALATPLRGALVGPRCVGVALALAGDRRRGLALAVPALGATVLLSVIFPAGGSEPYPLSSLIKLVIFTGVVLIVLRDGDRALRIGAGLYLLAGVGAYIVPSSLGDNVVRLGTLFAGPLVALHLAGRRRWLLALLAVPLLYYQWWDTARELDRSVGNPAAEESFYAPLVAELERRATGPVRIEIPPTLDRGEARWVAPRFPLAGGWLRQAEAGYLDLFTGGNLTAGSYRGWLDDRAVSWVARANAPLDYSAKDEAALIDAGLPYLREVWSDPDWTLYRVQRPAPLVSPAGAKLTRIGPSDFELDASGPGSYLVRIHYTPFWSVTAGDACVARDGDWTRVEANSAGPVNVVARLSLGGLLRRDHSCSG